MDIEDKKVDLRHKKVDIESLKLTSPMKKNIHILYHHLSELDFFGRSEVIEVLNLSASGASKLISKLLALNVIVPVFKHGKGKYCFNIDGV